MCTCAKKLDPCLVSDLHAAAGQQRDPPAQVSKLCPLREVELGACRTETVVEAVNREVILLADVAVPRFVRLAKAGLALAHLVRCRRKVIGRRKHRRATKSPDSCLGENALFTIDPFGLSLSLADLEKTAAVYHVGPRDATCCLEKAIAILDRNFREDRAVSHDLLEKVSCGAKAIRERLARCGLHVRNLAMETASHFVRL